ncbi:flavoprotein wrbA-like [Trifolium pratense]|uniref:Flavoprotein wrbA-like n=1 Tax=Trifolium pratense TaxID=57577 RepID=A0A2K3LVW1_TRIPR|nr:flavoprotein wrbA-like [Trifolium pratense]
MVVCSCTMRPPRNTLTCLIRPLSDINSSKMSFVRFQELFPRLICLAILQFMLTCFERRYYTTYGHVEKLAEEIKKGAASVEGVEANLWQGKLLLNYENRSTIVGMYYTMYGHVEKLAEEIKKGAASVEGVDPLRPIYGREVSVTHYPFPSALRGVTS